MPVQLARIGLTPMSSHRQGCIRLNKYQAAASQSSDSVKDVKQFDAQSVSYKKASFRKTLLDLGITELEDDEGVASVGSLDRFRTRSNGRRKRFQSDDCRDDTESDSYLDSNKPDDEREDNFSSGDSTASISESVDELEGDGTSDETSVDGERGMLSLVENSLNRLGWQISSDDENEEEEDEEDDDDDESTRSTNTDGSTSTCSDRSVDDCVVQHVQEARLTRDLTDQSRMKDADIELWERKMFHEEPNEKGHSKGDRDSTRDAIDSSKDDPSKLRSKENLFTNASIWTGKPIDLARRMSLSAAYTLERPEPLLRATSYTGGAFSQMSKSVARTTGSLFDVFSDNDDDDDDSCLTSEEMDPIDDDTDTDDESYAEVEEATNEVLITRSLSCSSDELFLQKTGKNKERVKSFMKASSGKGRHMGRSLLSTFKPKSMNANQKPPASSVSHKEKGSESSQVKSPKKPEKKLPNALASPHSLPQSLTAKKIALRQLLNANLSSNVVPKNEEENTASHTEAVGEHEKGLALSRSSSNSSEPISAAKKIVLPQFVNHQPLSTDGLKKQEENSSFNHESSHASTKGLPMASKLLASTAKKINPQNFAKSKPLSAEDGSKEEVGEGTSSHAELSNLPAKGVPLTRRSSCPKPQQTAAFGEVGLQRSQSHFSSKKIVIQHFLPGDAEDSRANGVLCKGSVDASKRDKAEWSASLPSIKSIKKSGSIASKMNKLALPPGPVLGFTHKMTMPSFSRHHEEVDDWIIEAEEEMKKQADEENRAAAAIREEARRLKAEARRVKAERKALEEREARAAALAEAETKRLEEETRMILEELGLGVV